MSNPKDSIAPDSPEQSSNPWALGFTQWFKNITDWIRLMSPAGASQHDTDWVTIQLTGSYEGQGSIPPQVRRVGRELRYRGLVKPTGSGDFATGTTHTIAASGAVSDPMLCPIADEYHPIVGNQAPMINGGRLTITALGAVKIDVGTYGSPYYSLFGVRSSMD